MRNEHFNTFVELISNQFTYGGQKYAATTTKEATDILVDDFGYRWLLGTVAKYTKRFANLARERDLLKIACYMYILWLKRGFHLSKYGSKEIIDTTVEVKTAHFEEFIDRVKMFYISYGNTKGNIHSIYTKLAMLSCEECTFLDIKEIILLNIFISTYMIWNNEIPEELKTKDEDVYNETRTRN